MPVYILRMSKLEILQELPKLKPDERREIMDRICELEEDDLVQGHGPSTQEKSLLDRELEDYRKDGNPGSTWEEVEKRLRNNSSE